MTTKTLNDKRIERLEKELDESRHAILRLAPDDVLSILQSYYFCKTREDANRWEKEIIEKVNEVAISHINGDDEGFFGQTSCPLCRRSSTSPYQRGYLIPTCLQRHLSGRGHAIKCDVMIAVLHLARKTWSEMFCDELQPEITLESEDIKQLSKKIALCPLNSPLPE